jgi:arginine/lysine/ornithine decarboxylase
MKGLDGAALNATKEAEVHVAMLAVRGALAEGAITAHTETKVQNTLHTLRSTSPCSEAVTSLECLAANLRLISEAKRSGRCNLYMSQLIRLRKQILA